MLWQPVKRSAAKALSLAILMGQPACSKDPTAQATASATPSATAAAAAKPAFDVEGFCEQVMALPKSRHCEGDDEIIEGNKVGYCTTMLREAREAERVSFDAGAASACVSAVGGSADLPDRRNLADLATRLEACRGVVRGQQAAGKQCARSMECKGDLVCVDKSCRKPAADGEACAALRDDGLTAWASNCAATSYCAAGTCKPRVADGGACNSSEACTGASRCRAKKCGPASIAKDGAPCDGPPDCGHDSYCGADRKCAPKKTADEPCSSSEECVGRCSPQKGKRCVPYCGSG